MDTIILKDIEAHFHIGVPDAERVRSQRLLISVELDLDTRAAAAADDLARTVNYFDLHQRIVRLGEGREWKLIESLAEDIGRLVLDDPRVQQARVTVKKFVLPETRYVAARIERRR